MKFTVVASVVVLILLLIAFLLWTPDKDRATLESLYLQSSGDLVDVGGVRLHVRDSGPKNAPAVLLLHGFGASLHTWEPWAQAWAQDPQHPRRVIRIDLPGSGLSAPDPSGDYSDERSLALLVALLDRLGVARTSVIGHSIGGRIAWTFAAKHPDRVDRLVLVAPDGFASPGFAYGEPPEVSGSLQVMRYVLPKPLLRMSLAPAYADPRALTPALATRYHDLMLAPGARDAMIARLTQTILVDPLPLLKRIEAPTLMLWGEQDAMVPFANSADYLRAIPNSRLASLPGVGHLPHEEAAERSLALVSAFLSAPSAPPAPSVSRPAEAPLR